MTDKRDGLDAALEGIDSEKRKTLRRMASMAFAAPVVASFAIDGLSVDSALAADSNLTRS